MSDAFLRWMAGLGPWSYLAIFAAVFSESGLLLLLPGETIVLLAGVLAYRGALSLPLVMAVAASSALLGDATGFALGRGPARRRFEARGRLLFLRTTEVARVKDLIIKHGGLAIVGSRFVAALRTATPFACGLTNLPPRRFFPYNVLACVAWGMTISGLGYLGGNAWAKMHHWIGQVSIGLGILLLVGSFFWARRRRTVKLA
jgi:membrane protein DedA with SNARE-associated domain